ncbi:MULTISPECIES: amino acid adenylation domain-containing protein [unclassified Streptomyces]|uniref:non-ribosomal peptide synthetase family protein n=1 Tax=unclassified Streptomyces TaxID=2593676 RepID=UPI002E80173D|nr:amino acid adenylation domain-containing protein [Streptomyces sp. NBC_00569]WSE13507.1 amino acid adenylation domain-containing protein [Streptomyces sp. NBC_01397]WUB97575.1 amino acid adenylation domain-containing protein [Streptomyces sp. NBC_00569]
MTTAQPTVRSTTRAHGLRLGGSLPELLQEQAAVQPAATAVTSDGESLSYQELAVAAARLGSHLNELGMARDDCVGLYAEPSLDLMTGVWGILFSGAAYLPLSPEYPEERLRYMIEDSRTDVIVTQDHLAARLHDLAPSGTRIVTLTEAAQSPATGLSAPAPGNLAYVIYTSGSTGRPKGVLIEHRSILNQMQWMQMCGHLGPRTTVLQKTPMSFDAAQWEILAPALGARVAMAAPGSYRDPEALINTIAAHEVTTVQCVPTLLQALLDTERLGSCTTLRRVFSGGEALSRQLARTFLDEVPWASLVNLYGPTECTINATAHLVDPDALGEGTGSVPIGVPVDNTQCYILDENLAPVDIGESGELYIGGVQLARGYLNRPEQTKERFVPSPFVPTERLYRTGDLAYWHPDGTIQFTGRTDNQIKLRGYRVELDEIALAIEEHTWVRRAAAITAEDPRTGSTNLLACVELNPKEAALMDQGNAGTHHQSKASKLQVKAQLSNPGLRDADELDGRHVLPLPGRQETVRQRRETFARKTYRYFDGGQVTRDDILALLAPRPTGAHSRPLSDLTFHQLGELLRWFGQFRSEERLLSKYSYASPGALYATQLYLEAGGLDGLDAGVYYYHPADHTLVRIAEAAQTADPRLSVHLIGKRRAIEPVYKNNIREVLEFEAGHMLGVFEEILPEYGLTIRPAAHRPAVQDTLEVAAEDYYLGTFTIDSHDGVPPHDPTDIYVQAHPGCVHGLPAGQYRWTGRDLTPISDALVLPKHVIAINQQVYERASFGITAVSRTGDERLQYIAMGTTLHHLQRNARRIGLMSSGYSSKTGHPLPAARRVDDILASCALPTGPSYFFLGGKVSEEQLRSEGMNEDAVHMKGPAEMIRDDLAERLPDYMIPGRVLVLERMPLTANGKVDVKALAAAEQVRSADTGRSYVAPANPAEQWLADAWAKALKYDEVSVEDDFFASGGNSLIAVALVNRINREFGLRLPLQVVFERPKLADLAARIEDDGAAPSSRLVPLHGESTGRPIFCWPGLGGYPMNLRLLAHTATTGRPFFGVQAHGINAGERPYPTIRDMAAADVADILRTQPEGLHSLWGYSFGARVAFEAAWQLEQSGHRVDHLLLICPGNPKVRAAGADRFGREASYRNPVYVSILYSVFAGAVSGPDVDACVAATQDEDSFVSFVHDRLPGLDEQLIRRITHIVAETYEFEYTFRELTEHQLNTPVTIIKAAGDDYSFIEAHSGYSSAPPTIVELTGDHYSVLKEQGIAELATAIRGLADLR